jgi:hypothetical protein
LIRTSNVSRDSDGDRGNLSSRGSNRLHSLGLLSRGLLLLLLFGGLLLVALQAAKKATGGGSALLLLLSFWLGIGLLRLGDTSNDGCACLRD